MGCQTSKSNKNPKNKNGINKIPTQATAEEIQDNQRYQNKKLSYAEFKQLVNKELSFIDLNKSVKCIGKVKNEKQPKVLANKRKNKKLQTL